MEETTQISEAKPAFNPVEFARETRIEINKVTWPSRKETMQTTFLVVAMALIAGIILFAIDTGLGFVVSHILGMSQ